MKEILYAVLVLGIMGAVFGAVLAIASKVFAVKTDERLPKLVEALPGANCGGCGFAGCQAYAQAVLEGRAEIGLCVAGGQASADRMAAVMGVTAATCAKSSASSTPSTSSTTSPSSTIPSASPAAAARPCARGSSSPIRTSGRIWTPSPPCRDKGAAAGEGTA